MSGGQGHVVRPREKHVHVVGVGGGGGAPDFAPPFPPVDRFPAFSVFFSAISLESDFFESFFSPFFIFFGTDGLFLLLLFIAFLGSWIFIFALFILRETIGIGRQKHYRFFK